MERRVKHILTGKEGTATNWYEGDDELENYPVEVEWDDVRTSPANICWREQLEVID